MTVRHVLHDDDLSPAGQAVVRLHGQKALLVWLLASGAVQGTPGARAAS
jgi:hypothetical protein